MKDFTKYEKKSSKNRIITGLIIAGYGILLLVSKFTDAIPIWIFSWPMLLIAFGLYTGLKHNFKNNSWIVFMLAGGIFLTDNILKLANLHTLILPIIIIGAGIATLTSSSPKMKHENWMKCWERINSRFEKSEL